MNIKKYREIAEAATPGPWYLSDDQNSVHQHIYQGEFEEVCNVDSSDLDAYQKNSAFIATFSPETVLRLLDTIEKYEAALKHIKNGCLVPPDGGQPNLQDAIDTAREALRGGKGDER